jgi:hypothetical protein
MTMWYILCSFVHFVFVCTFCVRLYILCSFVHFVFVCTFCVRLYILCSFGTFFPVLVSCTKKIIWQPWQGGVAARGLSRVGRKSDNKVSDNDAFWRIHRRSGRHTKLNGL